MAILFSSNEDIDVIPSDFPSIDDNNLYYRTGYCRCAHKSVKLSGYWIAQHSDATDYYTSFKVYLSDVSSVVNPLVIFGNTSFSQRLAIRHDTDSGLSLDAWDGSAYVTLVQTTVQLTIGSLADKYYQFLIYIKHGASGIVKVWLDDVLIIDYSGDLTSYITGGFTKMSMHSIGGTGHTGMFSEVVIADTNTSTYSVVTLAPTGDGTDTGFTGGYASIDEKSIRNSADLIYSDATGERSNFTLSNLPVGTEIVHGVVCSARAAAASTGPKKFRFYVILDGTRYYSDYYSPEPIWTTYKHIWYTRPDNSERWSRADVDALTIGVESAE